MNSSRPNTRLPLLCPATVVILGCLIVGCGPGTTPEVPKPRIAKGGDQANDKLASYTQGGMARPQPGSNPEKTGAAAKNLAGSKTCRSCHEDFYKLWATSNHGLAMQPYSAVFAQTKLAPQQAGVTIGKRTFRAEIGPNQGWVREQGPDGEHKYPIAHVMGGKNTYYFLTPFERGRLQVLPVAYDVHDKNWYDTAASGVRHFADRRDEALDWTDRMFTFNTTCFNCHVSELATNYDLATDTYHTTWAEPGISCESCHGPGGEHVRAMEEGVKGHTGKDIRIIRTLEFTAGQMNDMCATCHAKLIPLSTSFLPGDAFFDHYDLITLDNADFYPDGRDLGENYTMTSWLMSPCVKAGGLDCNHCHTPSGRPRQEGPKSNELCLPCHAEQVANSSAHSHHPIGNEGDRCITCHMPSTRFAAMGRSDHSMRSPTPATTIAFKSPNACNLCHKDKDAAWSNEWVGKWYKKDYQAETIRRAELLDAARKNQWKRLSEMLAEIGNKEGDSVYKASLVRVLGGCEDERKWPVLVAALKDPSPLVRSSAAAGLVGHFTPEVIHALLAATTDPLRVVRLRAVMSLAALPPEQITNAEDRRNLEKAETEFMKAMRARPDDWSSYANLGNYYMEQRDFAAAVRYFETAIKLEPRSLGPLVNSAVAYSNLGRNEDAEKSLRRALVVDPGNAAVNFNLGLLLGEQGRTDEAAVALRAAWKNDPQMAAAAYNLGVIVSKKDVEEAISWCEKAFKLRPEEAKYGHTLAFYQREKGNLKAAVETLKRTLAKSPSSLDAYLLLGEIYMQQGDRKAAAGLYRDALGKEGFSPQERQALQQRLQAAENGQ